MRRRRCCLAVGGEVQPARSGIWISKELARISAAVMLACAVKDVERMVLFGEKPTGARGSIALPVICAPAGGVVEWAGR